LTCLFVHCAISIIKSCKLFDFHNFSSLYLYTVYDHDIACEINTQQRSSWLPGMK
jgi:hypothetical protein